MRWYLEFYLISLIFCPPRPMIQPMRSLGIVISCVCWLFCTAAAVLLGRAKWSVVNPEQHQWRHEVTSSHWPTFVISINHECILSGIHVFHWNPRVSEWVKFYAAFSFGNISAISHPGKASHIVMMWGIETQACDVPSKLLDYPTKFEILEM